MGRSLSQSFRADDYRGKRMRMSAYVRADKLDQWAQLEMMIRRDAKLLASDT